MRHLTQAQIEVEFDRQSENLINKGYPSIFASLKKNLNGLKLKPVDNERGQLPFVIVIKNEVITTEAMMEKVVRNGKIGITKLFPLVSTDFNTLPSIKVPKKPAYLLIDIDRGRESLNVRPEDALKQIIKNKRTPLTIDEGIAILTHFPDFLMKNNCFSLLADRHVGDQRVPAIWINGKGNPNLGWCWDRNPHTWLGSASCGTRK